MVTLYYRASPRPSHAVAVQHGNHAIVNCQVPPFRAMMPALPLPPDAVGVPIMELGAERLPGNRQEVQAPSHPPPSPSGSLPLAFIWPCVNPHDNSN